MGQQGGDVGFLRRIACLPNPLDPFFVFSWSSDVSSYLLTLAYRVYPVSLFFSNDYVYRFVFDVSGLRIPQKTATIAMAGVSVFVLLWLLSNIFWWTLFSSGFLVGLHALLRDASMHKDMDDAVAMEGDFQGDLNLGEDAAFLNSA